MCVRVSLEWACGDQYCLHMSDCLSTIKGNKTIYTRIYILCMYECTHISSYFHFCCDGLTHVLTYYINKCKLTYICKIYCMYSVYFLQLSLSCSPPLFYCFLQSVVVTLVAVFTSNNQSKGGSKSEELFAIACKVFKLNKKCKLKGNWKKYNLSSLQLCALDWG